MEAAILEFEVTHTSPPNHKPVPKPLHVQCNIYSYVAVSV